MNSDGTCCYTDAELRDMDWRETGNGNEVELVCLVDPHGPALPPQCNHEDEECPAKKK